MIDESYSKALEKVLFENIATRSKPHLVALFILCQGYLAANIDYIPDPQYKSKFQVIKISNKQVEKTHNQTWWAPAVGNDYLAKEVNKELEANKGDKNKVSALITAINKNKSSTATFIKIVYDAYIEIKDNKLI